MAEDIDHLEDLFAKEQERSKANTQKILSALSEQLDALSLHVEWEKKETDEYHSWMMDLIKGTKIDMVERIQEQGWEWEATEEKMLKLLEDTTIRIE